MKPKEMIGLFWQVLCSQPAIYFVNLAISIVALIVSLIAARP